MPWNVGARIPNPDPNPLYSGTTMLKDPGAQPSATVGLRWTSDSGRDDIYLVANSINSGAWGYDNLQWLGGTYYHKFSDQWHIAIETWNIHEFRVPNLDNPIATAAIANGGTPFSPQIMPFNAPSAAHCGNTTALTCTADEQSFLLYVNYSPNKLNNFTFRTEFLMDPEGQRTGVVTNYVDAALGWQHWFSPQIEVRPEVAYYRSLNANAFNGNANAGIPPSRNWASQPGVRLPISAQLCHHPPPSIRCRCGQDRGRDERAQDTAEGTKNPPEYKRLGRNPAAKWGVLQAKTGAKPRPYDQAACRRRSWACRYV